MYISWLTNSGTDLGGIQMGKTNGRNRERNIEQEEFNTYMIVSLSQRLI